MGIAEPKPSNASSGWLHRFKRRNNITNINIGGEEASADRVAARDFPPFLREVMEEGRFTDDQVFNMDESGLFWKKLPAKTFVVQSASKVRGRKLQKERITVLYTTNASGTCKPKLSVIHTARKPHAYKNVDMSKINVHWLTARMTWMFSALSLSWFDDCFIPDVKKFCEQQNVPFKILLLLDNAPGHSPLLMNRHPNVKVVIHPPNTTSLIQPMDQELICNVKAAYSAKKFKLLNDCTNTKDKLRKLGDTDSESKSDEDRNNSQPVTVALDLAREAVHSITAEGFSETTNEDILEVIRDPEMTADEMLEDDNVSEEEEKLKLFLSNDPDDDRYEVFHTRLVQAMEPYIKVYQDNINTSRQKSISEFFARNPPQPARASDSDSESDFEGFVREALTTVTDSDGDAPSNGDSPEGQ
ncbi:Tigger transposable element-derived protein 1-like 72 [Homarus americanus]|uniref:Tigger transposable element-derived protein 1-like 72 n=2 Tax=Homarus americanus TaxID=6706 RepID=A0A8J5K3B3_HOMAM|nr:Tigger transposable element-derived protein 1-like 73 [Homarus americanus]KAG7169110.1 Tigger transposable element-derived protein 1-like 72 [Homarus americanus]